MRNTAAMTGGGAYAGDVLTLTTGLFQANQGHDGGGLYAASIAIVTATQFLNNASGGDGGGADVNGNSQIVNSLFAANQAGGHGQALYQNPSGVSYLFFDTVTSPTLGAGAAVYVVTGTTFLADSIVASYSVGLQNAGGGTLEGYNLFFAVPVTVTGNLFSAAHDVTGDPAFVDPSAGDYHLGPGSLAIDAGFGVGVATDFEGDPRPQGGGFDIGFDESPYTATADVGLTKTASAATLAPGETLTYTLQYTNAGPNVAAGVLLTDLVPANLTDLSYASSGAALAQVGPDSFAWQVDNLAPGAGGIVTLTGVLSGGLHGSVFTNTASISTAYSDTNLADNTSAVSVTVANVAPVAVADAASLGRNTTLTVTAPGVLANDTDGNGDPLTADLVAGPFTGTVDLRADGAFTYTPPFGFAGGVTFTYRASDRLADSNIVTVTLTVTNFAPVAVDDAYSLPADSPLTVTAPGLLANDTDANGDALTAALVAGPLTGTFGLQADGSFTYTPPLGYSGGVTFTYQANDGLALSNAATVTLTVGPPTANLGLVKAASASLLAPGGRLTYTLVYSNAGPDLATGVRLTDVVPANLINLSAASSGADITATAGLTDAWQVADLAPGAGGVITLTGVLSASPRGTVFTNTATISTAIADTNPANNTSAVRVTVANLAPLAVAEAYTLSANSTLTVTAPGLLANDTDGNHDPLTAVLAAGPLTGTLHLRADGSFSYTPPPGFSGEVTFTYRANDGLADSNTATVTITVTAVEHKLYLPLMRR